MIENSSRLRKTNKSKEILANFSESASRSTLNIRLKEAVSTVPSQYTLHSQSHYCILTTTTHCELQYTILNTLTDLSKGKTTRDQLLKKLSEHKVGEVIQSLIKQNL